MRANAGMVILVSILVILAVLGSRGGVASDLPPLPPETRVNRIAVVGLDGLVRSIKPDGTRPIEISGSDGFFTWPTWAPDGKKMVYSGLVNDGVEPSITLFEYANKTGISRKLHVGVPGFAGLLAEGVVHYPLWSPNSEKLAFVGVTSEIGLTLFLDDLTDDPSSQYVLDQGPLWMSWSGDSSQLLVHRAEEHFLVDTDDPLKVTQIGVNSLAYRVPAWKPDEPSITFARDVGASNSIIYGAPVTPDGVGMAIPIANVSSNSAFQWSSDGAKLAIADASRPVLYLGGPTLIFRELRILDSTDFTELATLSDNILAYFWSPDGTKIAYVSIPDSRGNLRWTLYDIGSGISTQLVDFVPSSDQMTMFQFFDQYAYSHSLWSPDSQFLVFAGTLSEQAVTASFETHPGHTGLHVFVLDTGPTLAIEAITTGLLGFWSPI
jgi:TolB protein